MSSPVNLKLANCTPSATPSCTEASMQEANDIPSGDSMTWMTAKSMPSPRLGHHPHHATSCMQKMNLTESSCVVTVPQYGSCQEDTSAQPGPMSMWPWAEIYAGRDLELYPDPKELWAMFEYYPSPRDFVYWADARAQEYEVAIKCLATSNLWHLLYSPRELTLISRALFELEPAADMDCLRSQLWMKYSPALTRLVQRLELVQNIDSLGIRDLGDPGPIYGVAYCS